MPRAAHQVPSIALLDCFPPLAGSMARSAASRTALCLAAAACLLGGAAAANLMGSATQGELQLSCTTPQTCGTLQNREWGALLRVTGLFLGVSSCESRSRMPSDLPAGGRPGAAAAAQPAQGLAAYMLPSLPHYAQWCSKATTSQPTRVPASPRACAWTGAACGRRAHPLTPPSTSSNVRPLLCQCWWGPCSARACSCIDTQRPAIWAVSGCRLTLHCPPLPVRCSRRPPHVPRLLGQHDLVPGEQRVLDSNWRGPCAVTCVALLADHPRPVTPSGPILSPDPVLPMLTQPLPSRLLQAAPFVAACRLDALAGGVCATSCATRLAPFNSDCFHSVLSEDYFLYAPDQQAPDATIIAAFYNACFPPAGAQPAAPAVDAPQQQKAPALSAAGAGMGAASSSAQAGSGVWGLVAALAAAALLAA